ncbi:MAG: hypothetical protein OEV42_11340 [Deltaproteobacteria bacterium]|nr:hypothetical protein [Deltaproteobacteria bacterium]
MISRPIVKLTFIFLLFLALPLQASASRMVVLMDSSGWMTDEEVNGYSKLDFASREVGKFLKKNRGMFDDLKVYFYDGDSCEDPARSAFKVEEARKNALELMKIVPAEVIFKKSLGDAIKGLNADNDKVFYISGRKACKSDPCVKYRMLRARGKSARFHVLGFMLPDLESMEKLKCLASQSGGQFYGAAKATDFKKALNRIEGNVAYNMEIKVLGPTGEEVREYMQTRYGYLWGARVFRAGDELLLESTHNFPAQFHLPAGIYDVKLKYGNAERLLKNVRIKEGKRHKETVSFAKGSMIVKTFSGKKQIFGKKRKLKKPQWWCEIYNASTGEKIDMTETFPAEMDLFSGKYDVKIHYMGQEKWLRGVEVQEDKTLRLEVKFK